MRRRILITGAAGFLGAHLMKALLENGETVMGIDNFWTTSPGRRVWLGRRCPIATCDVRDLEGFFQVARRFDPTHIVHLAALSNVAHSRELPHEQAAVNVISFLNVLELCRLRSTPLVYASSAAAKEPIQSPYGASKRANEIMAAAHVLNYGFAATGLRYHTLYGAWGRPDMAYFHFTDAIAKGKPITVYHGASRDFLEVKDAVGATLKALTIKEGHHLLDVGWGVSTQVTELVALLEQQLGCRAKIIEAPLPLWDPIETRADLTAIQQLLQWQPTIGLATGLAQFVKWWTECESRRLDAQ
jgi:UDP-glucuronate 4-epimerase